MATTQVRRRRAALYLRESRYTKDADPGAPPFAVAPSTAKASGLGLAHCSPSTSPSISSSGSIVRPPASQFDDRKETTSVNVCHLDIASVSSPTS
ncbi:hypothetical protein Cob_v005320 [Colletotrichum orbiculare MAFF 240422]|uniref:Uncharacterized protein n=1 Tax=Colletotrichum orbiculare (strain 104-T / ATCC 96160 / CBS 514.97 / LARS 414 / MAFF 240422) TaxID=1213857 RepID=A0A484FVK0_COLOR|nr:hypothetical protein Cob_v005320 [Colletotrichum orbiculare MAFF 240422]